MNSPQHKPPLIERCKNWWQNLGAWQQEVIATITPLVAVCLFLLATFTVFVYLKSEESARENQNLTRESNFALQRITALLHQRQEEMARLSRQLSSDPSLHGFDIRARELVTLHPEIQTIALADASGRIKQIIAAPGFNPQARHALGALWPGFTAGENVSAAWTVQRFDSGATAANMLQLTTTTFPAGTSTAWSLIMELSPEALLRVVTSTETPPLSHSMALVGADSMSPTRAPEIDSKKSYFALLTQDWMPPAQLHLPVPPLGDALQLHTRIYRTDSGLTDRAFLWLLIILGITTLSMLVVNWRLSRRRFQTQRQLQTESSFRRAIEDAMISGIRVLDMQGQK